MSAKAKFLEMFREMPRKARERLVIHYWMNPVSLNVIASEIRARTDLGKLMLKDLGYEAEVNKNGNSNKTICKR